MLSVVAFVAMASCIKAAGDAVPTGEAVFFRSAFALPPILLWISLRGGLVERVASRNPAGHLWRGLLGVSAMSLGFFALTLLPLPEVVSIGYAAPLLATLFAAMFLGERLRVYRLTAIAVGFAGVLLVLSPRLGGAGEAADGAAPLLALGALAALFSAVMSALAQTVTRGLVATERTDAVVFWFTITCTTVSLATLPFGWTLPPAPLAGLLALSGVLGGVGQIFLTESYRHAELGTVAPFEYTSMLFALAIGYLVFDEVPTGAMLAGGALIVAAGLAVVYRERKLGLERARARAVSPTQG